MIFNLYIGKAIIIFKYNIDTGTKIAMLRFADDITLLRSNKKELEDQPNFSRRNQNKNK